MLQTLKTKKKQDKGKENEDSVYKPNQARDLKRLVISFQNFYFKYYF